MKVIKDSIIYLIGEVISKSAPFLLLPYLSRKLGVEGFGELSYYQTFLVLFVIIISLSQDGAVSRYFYVYGKRALNTVVIIGYFYTLCVGTLILIICWIFKLDTMCYVIIAAIFQSFINVQLSLRQCQKKALAYVSIQLFSAISSTLLTILLLELFSGDLVQKRFLAIFISNLFIFIISYFLFFNEEKFVFKISFSKFKMAFLYILGFGVPLILHHVSIFLKGQLDRIVIYHNFSEKELGLYAMGAQLSLILMVIIQAANKAVLPYFFEGLKNEIINITRIRKWFFYSILFMVMPILIITLIPNKLFIWVLGHDFIGVKYYVILFSISVVLTIPYLLLVNYLFFYGKNKVISVCSLISTIVYMVILYILSNHRIEYIPYASIIGAATVLPMLYTAINRDKNS